MIEEQGVKAHITIEKSRVWDLKSTGQVSSGLRNFAAISCICFHPTDPTLCVVTVQGPLSILSFYNVHSGGKMSTVPLRSVVAAAQFTSDGNQIVIIFRDWNVMLLRPGSPRWTRTLIPFKREQKPAEQVLLALNPAPLPVIYFTLVGQTKINVVLSEVAPAKGTLLSGAQKNAFSLKLANAAILGIAGHPEEYDILIALFNDGSIQAFSLDQGAFKKLYTIGGGDTPAGGGLSGNLSSLQVLPHPFAPKACLILVASTQEVLILASQTRSEISIIDKLPLKGFRKVTGLGLYKSSQLLLAFGESGDGKVTCHAAKISGDSSSRLSLVPISVKIDSGATDVSLSQHSVSGIINVTSKGSGSWMELWDAVPTWAQNPAQISQGKQKIRNVKIHSTMHAIAAQVSSSGSQGSAPHILLWTVHDNSHPSGGAHSSLVVPHHTSLLFWSGGGSTEGYKLEFPHRLYYVSGNQLMGYVLRCKESSDVMVFTPPRGKSATTQAEAVVFSQVHKAWLLFFRGYSANVGFMGSEEWTYTLQREAEVGASPPWFKSGVSGSFIGPNEDHFCILDPDLFTLHCYPTKTTTGNQSPLLSLALPAPGLLSPVVFPGPPITQIPEPPAPPEFTQSGNIIENIAEEGADLETEPKLGYGVIIWVNKFRQIAMGSIMSHQDGKKRSRYEPDSVECIQGGTFSELGDGEIIIQVAWQRLIENEDSTHEPNSYCCVVMTNQRLMLFLANGYPVLSFPPQNSPGLASPPTSCLWVGPALLYVTRSGEVNQLLWNGTTVMICGAPSTTGSAVLVSALADRVLFLCRDTESDSWNVSTRHAITGFALLMGWATLASSGLVPPSWANAYARAQMKIVLQHFDLTTVSAPVTKALVQSSFADIARIVANRWTKEAQKIKVACSVAAGEWKEAAASLKSEHQNSIYCPGPIPKGSALWKRFYSVALGAVSNGNTEVAAELFSIAGEWEWALLFLAISSNTIKANEVVKKAEEHSTKLEIQKIKSLAAEFERTRIQSPTGEPLLSKEQENMETLESWVFAASGYVAPMYCIQGDTPQGMIKTGDIGVIDPLETQDIKGYVSGASKQPSHRSFLRKSISASLSGKSTLSRRIGQQSRLSFSIPEVLEVGEEHAATSVAATSSSMDTHAKPNTVPSPKHRSGFSDLVFDDNFSSDDDNDDASGGDTNELERGGFGKKFKIQIKKKEESHSSTSADALREAAKNLRLGALALTPSLGPSGFSQALKGGGTLSRTESVSSKSSSTSNLDQRFNAPLGESSSDPFNLKQRSTGDVTSLAAKEAFQKGIGQMEGGHWDEAIEELSSDGIFSIERGKQYLAAVLLLKAREGTSGNDAARIDRLASSLNLEDKHRTALANQAIKQNMECGNYAYASEKISWLLNASSGKVSSLFTSEKMQQLDECNSKGTKNTDISPFENLNAFPGRIESTTTVVDMRKIIEDFAS